MNSDNLILSQEEAEQMQKDARFFLRFFRPVGQAVKTPPFHGGIMGSIPVRVTNQKPWNEKFQGFLCFIGNFEKEEF